MNPGRNLSLASLALLGVLTAGFAVWSGLTAPEVAGMQLQIAGQNLAAASGVVETSDITESVIGTPEILSIHETRIRNTPDRVMVTESVEVSGAGPDISYSRTLTQIGDSCWTTITSTRKIEPLPCVSSTVRIRILSGVETESGVSYSQGTYMLSPRLALSYLRPSIPYPVGMVSFELRITGDYVTWEHVSFDESEPGATVSVDQTTRFADFGHAPRIVEPKVPPTATTG